MKNQTFKKISSMDLSWLCSQLALVIRSGTALSQGMQMVSESLEDSATRKITAYLAQRMLDNVPLSEAVQSTGAFPPYFVNMVRIGETSGSLDVVMESLAGYYERDWQLRRRLRSALMYPLMLALLMGAVILLLLVRVLPIFNDIMHSLGGELPGFARGLMEFGTVLARYPIRTAAVVMGVIILFRLFCHTPVWRMLKDRLTLTLPGLSGLFKKIYSYRFALSMSYMLKSGVDMDSALRLTEATVGNRIAAARIGEARSRLESGEDPFDALSKTGVFPKLFVNILMLGRKTGDLDSVMEKVARSYESDVNDSLTRLTAVVEPLLVVVLSGIVGAILLTVMLPLVDIMSSIG